MYSCIYTHRNQVGQKSWKPRQHTHKRTCSVWASCFGDQNPPEEIISELVLRPQPSLLERMMLFGLVGSEIAS